MSKNDMRPLRIASMVLCCCAVASLVAAQETLDVARQWPAWRGPLASGFAPHADPPVVWDESTNVKWKVRVPGDGSSTPIVWGDRVFVTTAVETDRVAENPPRPHPDAKTRPPDRFYQFVVLCLERDTGRTLWQQVACEEVPHEGRHGTNSYASASPVTDGRAVYASFGSRGIFSFSLDGQPRWRRDLGDMRTRYGWGEATSPVVHQGSVIINWDHEDQSFIAVLDAETGETKWQIDRDEVTSWATPLVVPFGGRIQVVVNGTSRVRAYDLANGEVIWQCGGQTVNAIPSPVVAGGVVVCMSGYRGAAAYAIPLDARGDVTGGERIVWSHGRGTPYVPSPLLYEDRIYFTGRNSPILTCLDAGSGEAIAAGERLPGLSSLYASPVGAAGRIYFVDRDGTTLVVKHGRPLEVLATNKLDDAMDGSPAVVGKQMFLRGRSYLYCIEAE